MYTKASNHAINLLISSSAIIISAIVFISGQKRYVKIPPQGSAIIDACKVLNIVRQEKHFKEAMPSALEVSGRLNKYKFATSSRYTDQYVLDVCRGFRSCRVSPLPTSILRLILTDIRDVCLLTFLFCMLDSDLEQLDLTSWDNGITRNPERPFTKSGPDRVVYFHSSSRL